MNSVNQAAQCKSSYATVQVKTLRGHEEKITDAVVIGGAQVNWENPKPPLVVSISSDGSIKAWDVSQVKQYDNSYTP